MLASLLFALSLASAQQPPSAVRLCADAAEGAELEVCLALVAEHPDAVDGIAAALRAHLDRSGGGDRALLRGLIGLGRDDEAVGAAASLAELGDPRAIPSLMVTAESDDAVIMRSAITALATFSEAHEVLAGWLLDDERAAEQRIAVARALATAGGDVAGDALVGVARRARTRRAVRDVALERLESQFPERFAALDSTVRRDGTVALAVGGGVAAGQLLGAAGHFAGVQLAGTGTTIGVLGGSTAGWVMGRSRPMEGSQALFLASGVTAGVTSGALVGGGLSDGSDNGAWAGATAGNVLGMSLGMAFRTSQRSVGDVWEANALAAALGITTGTGAVFFRKSGWRARQQPDDTGIAWGMLGGGVGTGIGAAVGHVVAPHIALSGPDVAMMSLAAAYGLGIGIAAPAPNLRRGLPVMGMGGGLIIGYAVAGLAEPRVDAVVGAASGALFGGGIGTGLGLLVDADASSGGAVTRGFALAGSGVGIAVGALAGTGNPELFDRADVVFTGLTTGVAAMHAVGLYTALTPRFQHRGWFVLGPSVLGGLAAATTPWVDIPVTYSLTATSVGVWSGWFGYGISRLGGALRRDQFLTAIVASDVGLAAGLLLAGEPVNLPPIVVGLADGGAVLGGAVALIGATLISSDADQILLIGQVGSAVGLGLGAGIAVAVRAAEGYRDLAFVVPHVDVPGRWSLTPTALPGERGVVPGLVLRGDGW